MISSSKRCEVAAVRLRVKRNPVRFGATNPVGVTENADPEKTSTILLSLAVRD